MWPALLLSLALQAGGLAPAERKGIQDALFVGNLSLRDLEFERKPFSDPYRIGLVNLALDRPLEAADALLRLHEQGLGSASSALRAANLALAGGTPVALEPEPPQPDSLRTGAQGPAEGQIALPKPVADAVSVFAAAIAEASRDIDRALQRLDAPSRRKLLESLPQLAVEEPSIPFDFVRQPVPSRTEVLSLLSKVDLAVIRRAGIRLYDVVAREAPRLARLRTESPFQGIWRGRVAGMQVQVGGTGRDSHDSRDAVLCIDFGGDDTYRGRFGAGAGYASVLIDVSGDDEYLVTDLAMGAGLLGVGIALDLDGNDVVRSRSLSLGCGIAGVGVYEDRKGYDMVRGVALTQGFGMFGIGLLFDHEGKDVYTSGLYGQGSARTQGFGWLVDREGEDTYRIGGVILNAPLFPDVHYSFGQGYGSGYREDNGGVSGGVGLLTDGKGDDAYIGETYCQAASYWFSLGSLYDRSGHDTYSAYHYSQASAMHATAAYLFDLAGDDAYAAKLGASHAIGHDYGVAFLLDRAGNDLYAARDSRPAIGIANGLAIFLDSAGQDRYFGPPGVGNPGRGSGSLGVFVDLEGDDVYAAGLDDREAVSRQSWSVALDADPGIAIPNETVASVPRVGTAPMPSDAEMEQLYKLATQWGVGTAQGQVQQSLFRLQEIGLPALRWMIDRKLKGSDRLQNRAFATVVQGLGIEGRLLLAPKCASPNLDEARNAIRISTDLRIEESAPHVTAALKVPALQRLAALAAGPVKAREAIGDLIPLAASPDRLLAIAALASMTEIGDEQALPTGQALLGSSDLAIRKAALALVAKFPDRARSIARQQMDSSDERLIRTGVELLAKVANEDDLSFLGRRLRDPRAGVKISVMTALNGRVPPEHRADLAALMADPNPLVRAVAARTDPGR